MLTPFWRESGPFYMLTFLQNIKLLILTPDPPPPPPSLGLFLGATRNTNPITT